MKRRALALGLALLSLLAPLSIQELFAAAPITANLLVSLDPSNSTISGATAGASDGTTPTGTMQASGMFTSGNNYVTFGDSTNQYIDYGNIGSTAGDISLDMWVNITSMHTGGWNILASKWFNGTIGSDWHFGYYLGKLRLCYNGVCPTAGLENTVRGTGWHHVAFTISQPPSGTCPGSDNGTVTLYFDSTIVAQDISTGACHPVSSNMLFVIGDKRATANLGIDGQVSKFRFYTRALTATDMSKIFRAEASTYGLSAAPYNTAIPTFSGTSRIGNIQTGSAGTWINTPTSYSYRWYRASTSTGTYSAISGATSLSYTPITADSNQFLKLEVTATNAQGSTVETSTATQMIQGVPNLSLSSGLPVATYRTVRNLTLTPGSLGKVTFFNNDKRIAGCIGLVASAANSYSVTCPWKASKIGTNTVKASFTSDDAGYVGGTTTITSITIQRRSTAR